MTDKIKPEGLPSMGGFEIYLVWSEKTLHVAEDETALKALLEAGVPVSPGCMVGGCGECATEYVEGDLLHKDSCLAPFEREHRFCPCVSRAATRIVIPH